MFRVVAITRKNFSASTPTVHNNIINKQQKVVSKNYLVVSLTSNKA